MKKKCLLILPRNIFPVVGGYAIKTINVVKILCEQYDTKVIIISETPISKEEKEFYDTNAVDYFYFYASKWRFYLNTLLGFFSKKPLQCSYVNYRAVEHTVAAMGQDSDIAVATTIRTAPYLDCVNNSAIKVIDMVDSIGLNYTRSTEKTTSIFWRLLFLIETRRLMKYETQSVRNVDLTWYVNNDEAKYWSEIGNTLWTPMSIKEFLFGYTKKDNQYNNCIAFFGKMNYQPNVDALLWYYNNVHTKIKNPPRLIIVGANPTHNILKIAQADHSITITGFVEDPYSILNGAKAIVAPMQTGGGVQNKVLETMALGKVNILSELAASPITGAVDGEHFLIANTASDYEKYFKLLDNTSLSKEIGAQAREFISKQYRFDKYKQTLICSIETRLTT